MIKGFLQILRISREDVLYSAMFAHQRKEKKKEKTGTGIPKLTTFLQSVFPAVHKL